MNIAAAPLNGVPLPTYAASLQRRAAPAPDTHERAARLQWVEQARLLRQRSELLARGSFPQVAPADKALLETLQPFLDEAASLDHARAAETSSLWSELQRAKQSTAKFRELVVHLGSGPEFVSQLQEVMEGAERRLIDLRQGHEASVVELNHQEAALTQELDALHRMFDAPIPDEPPPTVQASRTRRATTEPPDDAADDASGATADGRLQIAELEKQLSQLGGVDCGWEADEHAAYMRLRAKLLGPAPEVAAALTEAAGLGEQSIKMAAFRSRVREALRRMCEPLKRDYDALATHEACVQQRELALARKRELLHSWRQRRHEQAASAREASEATAEELGEAARAAEVARDERRRRDEAARQQQLDGWREKKRLARQAEEAARRAEEEARARRAAADITQRRLAREELAGQARQRSAEAAALRELYESQAREERRHAGRGRQLELLALRERDATLVARRREQLQGARESAGLKQERLRLLAAASQPKELLDVARDPERLMRRTCAMSARELRAKGSPRAAASFGAKADPSAFGTSSQRFESAVPYSSGQRPSSASANRHGSRTPSWRASIR